MFILVDPSLANHLGHHHEYAKHVLSAAAVAGCEPVLACNCRILYVGDARVEKSHHHLLSILDDLWEDHIQPGKVGFVIQSHDYTRREETSKSSKLESSGRSSR